MDLVERRISVRKKLPSYKLEEIYRDILDVPKGATGHELDAAYRSAKNIYTRNNRDLHLVFTLCEIDEISKLISEAYEALRFKKRGSYLESNFTKKPDFEHRIKNQVKFDGSFLKLVRVYKNITLKELSDFTRIKIDYLHAIENHKYDEFPSSEIYVRGFLTSYARALNLDASKVVGSYMSIKASGVR